MADLETTQVTTYRPIVYRSIFDLNAGGKLADNQDLLAMAQKTVPTGKKANVNITIEVQLEDV